jgi:hypothetical protein
MCDGFPSARLVVPTFGIRVVAIDNKCKVFCIAIQIKHGWVLGIIMHPTSVNVVVDAFRDALENKKFVSLKAFEWQLYMLYNCPSHTFTKPMKLQMITIHFWAKIIREIRDSMSGSKAAIPKRQVGSHNKSRIACATPTYNNI